jgi:rhodanese-related sulfurtransferase
MKHITVTELKQRLENEPDLTIIDVRSLDEYRMAHIPQAKSLPLDIILDHSDRCSEEIKPFIRTGETLYVVCLSDRRSVMACQRLAEIGFNNTCFIEGGTKAWISAGFPTVSEYNH